jgi:hypothetical protein
VKSPGRGCPAYKKTAWAEAHPTKLTRKDNGETNDIGTYEYLGAGRVAVLPLFNGSVAGSMSLTSSLASTNYVEPILDIKDTT